MKKKGFKSLEPVLKKAIFDGVTYYSNLQHEKIFVTKKKDFGFDLEYVLLDNKDLITVSLLLGILNTENYMSAYLKEKKITKESVLKYLGVEDFSLDSKLVQKLSVDDEIFVFLKHLNKKNFDLNSFTLSLFKKFICNSDIVQNFYLSSISNDISGFLDIRSDIENHSNSSLFSVSDIFDLNTPYNFN